MNRRKRLNTRQLEREKLLFRYSSALERGDFEALQTILRQAENDPVLEQMIWDVNEVYRTELPVTALRPTLSMNSLNHRNTRKDEHMTTYNIPINRLPHQAQTRNKWSAITLAAAVFATFIIGAALLSLQKPNNPQPNNAALQLVSATPTPIVITRTPEPSPTPSPAILIQYTVQPGDTALSILVRYNLSLAQFAAANPDLNVSTCDLSSAGGGADCQITLFVGQVVYLPADVGGNSFATVIPTLSDAFAVVSPCQAVVIADPHAELYSMPSFDGQVSTVVGYVPLGTSVSILQEQPSNNPELPFTWYLIIVDSDGSYLTGWTTSAAVQFRTDCSGQGLTAVPVTVNPCEIVVSAVSLENPTPVGAGIVEPLLVATPTLPGDSDSAAFTATAVVNQATQQAQSVQATQQVQTVQAHQGCITPTPTPFDFVPVIPGATPTAGFDSALRDGGYVLVTNEQVGSIAADTEVRISHATFTGTGWIYTVVTRDGSTVADAYEYQLRYAPDITPSAPPPIPLFNSIVGMGGYNAITIEPVGAIPAGSRVQLSSMWWDGRYWVYQIRDENGQLADAREYQLQPAPGVILGAPTPTAALFGIDQYYLVTRVEIGAIPAGTLVQITTGYYNGNEWVYGVTTRDGRYGEALESQLTVAVDQPGPTAVPTFPSSPVPSSTPTLAQ
jgi:hypothetical protein